MIHLCMDVPKLHMQVAKLAQVGPPMGVGPSPMLAPEEEGDQCGGNFVNM